MFIDTHCHLAYMIGKDDEKILLEADIQKIRDKIINQMIQSDVAACITVGTNILSSHGCVQLAHAMHEVYATVGIHPNDITDAGADQWKQDIIVLEKIIQDSISQGKVVAIGECGLDYHYIGFDAKKQQAVFRAQLELAISHKLPVVIHSRDAIDDTLAIVDEYKKHNLQGVMHCFSENIAYAQAVVDRGFFIGIGGALTYPKNNYLRDVVRSIGLDHIVLETDAPFLAPQVHRGMQNSPANIPLIAHEIAKILQVDIAAVACKTTANVAHVFDIMFV